MTKLRSYHLINEKVQEADYFLAQMCSSKDDFDAFRFRFSAFCSAARSIVFVLRFVGTKVSDFATWDSENINPLWEDPVTKFFLDARNALQKEGVNPVLRSRALPSTSGDEVTLYYFGESFAEMMAGEVFREDALSLCREYMRTLTALLEKFYSDFRREIECDTTELDDFRRALKLDRERRLANGEIPWTLHEDSLPEVVKNAVLEFPKTRIQALIERYRPFRPAKPPGAAG